MGALKRIPALGKDLLEDTPVPRGLWHHRGAPSWGDELLTVQRLYHASSASSTPHRPVLGQPSLASFILESRGLPGSGKCKILCYGHIKNGLNFLGFHLRKFGSRKEKLLTVPQKEKVLKH